MVDIKVAWWNLENLFDSATADRDPELASAIRGELVGWTAAVRDRKLDQLASVINGLFDGDGPDLLGVCEVENERVLEMLADRLTAAGRDYRVVTHASHDTRGIDVSFIVDANVLEETATGHQVVLKRTATRDLFWAELTHLETGNGFVAIANHWPARSAGKYESEPYRMLTGETLSYTIAKLFEDYDVGSKLPILAMGDFNDEPFDRSMQSSLLGTRDRGRVVKARTPRMHNLMWSVMDEKNPGTYRYGSDWNMLDQFLVSRGMSLSNSPVQVKAGSVEIVRPEAMLGSAGKPKRFGRPAKSHDPDGFSDHFPITVVLESK